MADSSAAKAYKYRQEISQVRYRLLAIVPEHFQGTNESQKSEHPS
jgi:hypothetical protein